MKICIVCFGNISAKQERAALDFYNYSVITYLYKKGWVQHIFCLDYDTTVPISPGHITRFSGTPLSRICYYLSKLLSKFSDAISERLIMELAFDFFVSSRLGLQKGNLLLNIKGINLRTYRRARAEKVPVAILADVCHPYFIRSRVEEVEERFGISDCSVYTSRRRVELLVKAFTDVNLLIPMIGADVVYASFIGQDIPAGQVKRLQHVFGVDCNTFKPAFEYERSNSGPVRFFTVNQTGLIKGFLLLMEAWAKLAPVYRQQGIISVAGSVDAASLKAAEHITGNFAGVEFDGFMSNIHAAYHTADVFIAASVTDLGPRTVMEAMASGLPVIVSNSCGISDWIADGVEGFRYDAFDTDRLAALMQWCIDNKSKLEKMGTSSRAKALTFGYEQYNKEVEQTLLKMHDNTTIR